MTRFQTNMHNLISVAPMMDCTDRHDRYFLRLIAPDILLYTEMITTHALIHGDASYLLGFDAAEHPLALQLGGSDPNALADCAAIGQSFGYDEINLNVGCPSDRVKSGQFGACLMLNPALVAECVSAMCARVSVPVTVKCRIGVDDQDSYESLHAFIALVASAGCKVFIIHARKAWLKGLSPKQNRDIPPLCYDTVARIKADFPQLTIIINGGIKTVTEIEQQLRHVDGVMIGREAYSNPYLLADVQAKLYPQRQLLTRSQVIEKMLPYINDALDNKVKLSAITRHLLGIYHGQRGASAWRRYISQHAHIKGAGIEVLEKAGEQLL